MKQELPKKLPPFLWHVIYPFRWYFIGMMVTGLLWGLQTSVAPYFLKLMINDAINFTGKKTQIFSIIKVPAIIYILLFAFGAFNFRFTDWLILRAIPGVRKKIIVEMYAYLQEHSHRYFQDHFAGSLINKITDMQEAATSILQKFDQTFSQICALFIAVIAMWLVHPLFSVILLVWAIIFVLVSLACTRAIKNFSNLFSASKTTLVGNLVDNITNIINIRIFARSDFESSQIEVATTDTITKDQLMQRYVLRMRIYQDISIIVLMTLMLAGLIEMYGKGQVTIGDFAFILSVSVYIFQALWFLASQFVQFAEDIGKCLQALTIINAEHEIVDAPNAKPLQITEGNIHFDKVTFNYQSQPNIFKNTNLLLEKNKKVGLVGFSGSGKTTFVNLILRFYNLKQGRILIDNQNIAEVSLKTLHESIALIPQDIYLFHRSLLENIRYGRLDATDEEVISASKRAHCHEFITQIPEGYHALVGERGIKLSGGQRQRIAIARAILKNAPILILDEATSALDSVTEKLIQEALHTLMIKRTTIVIAHRLSTLAEMDRILVFDKGAIIEDGNHITLLKANGHYAKLWRMQAGGFLPEQDEAEMESCLLSS